MRRLTVQVRYQGDAKSRYSSDAQGRKTETLTMHSAGTAQHFNWNACDHDM
jgi:hypothetical protein